ncbi:energy transducer TonB [Tenacibaculum agarivorans]|uniref:energy transducer TonB n=1 Tax=Tenacibaculum agarivorans TaxID=1908389 RepID=UPI00094BC3AB|nr:energy transducer TonB [Tenacibaculum agarivorans]
MRNIIYCIFFTVAATFSSYAQKETCETKEEHTIEDLNSITKCTVKSKDNGNKKSRQISVRVSASNKRFLKRRKKQSSANKLSGAGITSIENTTSINNTSKLKTNMSALTNRLTKEELRSAKRFTDVDNIPAFPDCGATDKSGEQVDCFNTEMMKHIQQYFYYPDEAIVNKLQGDVWVRFIIDKDGLVTNIKALGPKGSKILNDEAIRVVSNLPKFTPAVKDGEVVSVKYGFPINFSLEDN